MVTFTVGAHAFVDSFVPAFLSGAYRTLNYILSYNLP